MVWVSVQCEPFRLLELRYGDVTSAKNLMQIAVLIISY